jgi:hypothetical protein
MRSVSSNRGVNFAGKPRSNKSEGACLIPVGVECVGAMASASYRLKRNLLERGLPAKLTARSVRQDHEADRAQCQFKRRR